MEEKFIESNVGHVDTTTRWTSNFLDRHDGSNIDMDKSSRGNSSIDPMTTNTIVAVVSALLATTFLLLLLLVTRVLLKRRHQRQERRSRPPVVHTISTSQLTGNTTALQQVPISGRMSWENVSTSSAPVLSLDTP